MASGPHFDKQRGTYRVQWHDGYRWRRPTVHKISGWKPGSPEPKKIPPEAQAAVKIFADRERAARSNRPVDPSLSVVDFLATYRIAFSVEHADGSIIQLNQAVRTLAAWCAVNKVVRLDQITTSVCQKFLDWRAAQISKKTGKPISPGRVNQERALLSGAWSRAVKLGEMPASPWKPTTAPGWSKERKKRKERSHWTPEQYAALIVKTKPWLRDLLTLGTQSGLRIAALCGLEWRDIRWTAKDGRGFGTIVVRPELDKAGRGYSVPMSKTAHDLLFRLSSVRNEDCPFVLHSARGRKLRVSVTDPAIRRACRRAGLRAPSSPNHHMRRTFGRWAVLGQLTKRAIPVYVVMRWFGHSHIETTMSYLDLTDTDNQDWMAEPESRE
jgi:integrase